MKTKIKVGTDLELDALARKFLSIYDTDNQLAIKEKEFRYEEIIEVSLEVAVKIKVDIISVVESEINEEWWETTTDAEQFLVHGITRQVSYDDILYLQGNGWETQEHRRVSTKMQHRQEKWESYID